MQFSKYHALGNAYLVMESCDGQNPLSEKQIQAICSMNYGIGSDGILLKTPSQGQADFALRIFNPDGSEAEKSGNGLRIFCRYLYDKKQVNDQPFSIQTLGGLVNAQVFDAGQKVRVEMGRVDFHSTQIPVAGAAREVINETINILDQCFVFSAVSIGNPHCVIFTEQPSEAMARQYGPVIETHQLFSQRINVQFVKVVDRNTLQLEIWERGAGYTHASGSSSCAAAAVAYRLGYCDNHITLCMRGGELDIQIQNDGMMVMTGPVTAVCAGELFLA